MRRSPWRGEGRAFDNPTRLGTMKGTVDAGGTSKTGETKREAGEMRGCPPDQWQSVSYKLSYNYGVATIPTPPVTRGMPDNYNARPPRLVQVLTAHPHLCSANASLARASAAHTKRRQGRATCAAGGDGREGRTRRAGEASSISGCGGSGTAESVLQRAGALYGRSGAARSRPRPLLPRFRAAYSNPRN